MRLTYFVVDDGDQLRRVPNELIEDLWKGKRDAAALPVLLGSELRLISVLSDENLEPAICFFVRLELEEDRITDESKISAFEAMTAHRRRRYDTEAAQRQFHGWPNDWRRQLAVALDVPADRLRKIGLGGPLLMSELWGIPLTNVLAYFEEAIDE